MTTIERQQSLPVNLERHSFLDSYNVGDAVRLGVAPVLWNIWSTFISNVRAYHFQSRGRSRDER